MEAIGFDYDYTLANYNEHIQPLIYTMALNNMVEKMSYPADLLNFKVSSIYLSSFISHFPLTF